MFQVFGIRIKSTFEKNKILEITFSEIAHWSTRNKGVAWLQNVLNRKIIKGILYWYPHIWRRSNGIKIWSEKVENHSHYKCPKVWRSWSQWGLQQPLPACHLKRAHRTCQGLELGRKILIKIKVIHFKFTATGTSISYVLVWRPDQGGKENIWSWSWHTTFDI